MKRITLAVVALALVLGFIFWQYTGDIFNSGKKVNAGPITLTYWSTSDDETSLKVAAANYEKLHPNIQINIVHQSLLNYRTRLQTQLRAGQGPDLFRIHSSWLSMLEPDLAPLPSGVLSLGEYSQSYYPIVPDSFASDGKAYALPTEVDGLVLFVNSDILQGAGVTPPKTWQDFVDDARKVTVRDQAGQIQTAGAAMGTTTNVDYWPEIINLLFLQQPNTSLINPATEGGAEVLQFYTSFVTDPQNKTWDTNLPTSGQMFAAGKLAFYFAPVRQAQTIKATNPDLAFAVVPVPQLPGNMVDVGTFWGEAVSNRSAHPDEAWQFLKYLTSPEVLQSSNQVRVQAGLQQKVYPRIDMGSLQSGDPVLGAVVLQAPYLKDWYLNSDTQDVGINQEMVNLYKSVIDSVMQGNDPQGALSTIAPQIQPIIDKYSQQATPPANQ